MTVSTTSTSSLIGISVTTLFSSVLLPYVLQVSHHTITFEEYSYLVTLSLFLILSSASLKFTKAILISLIVGGIFYVFGPVLLDFAPPATMPLMQFPFGTNLYPNLESKKFIEMKEYQNLTMKSIYEIVATIDEPVIFRNVVSDSEVIARRIVDRLSSTDKKYMSQRFKLRPYDFFRGSEFEASLWTTIAEVMASKNNEYIGFEPLLTPDEYTELFGNKDPTKLVDHSFLSNFNETLVTTFVHGAVISTSWSFQLAGKKTWFFWDPKIFNPTMNTGWFCRVVLPSHGDEFALFSLPTLRVTVGPGDILVFPPSWYHTVVTHSGFNNMITFRTKYGNWLPSMIPTIRFYTAAALINVFGRNTPHYLPGIRRVRMDDMQRVFKEAPSTMRWENPEIYT